MSIQELHIAKPRWGISFAQRAATGDGLPLQIMPVPDTLIVSLQQHGGASAEPLHASGSSVAKGEPIGRAADSGVQVHAPTSGHITAIALHPVPGGGPQLCVFIQADHEDRPWSGYAAPARPLELTATELRAAIAAAGIVGLGGAMFPANIKLNPGTPVRTLILNGVECEPRINCDDALLRHHSADILLGAQIMLRILDTNDCVIALKADTPAAIAAIRAAIGQLGDERFRIALLPPVYPAGGEAQLVQLLSGQEIPAGGLPRDTGHVCQNVATAAAVARFFYGGDPLISRIVTVTGSGICRPVNIAARIGTPIAGLIAFAGGYTTEQPQLVMGGPMMGVPLANDDLPVTKGSNCIYVHAVTTEPAKAAMPCIRCTDCATVCPVGLTPQLLLQAQRTNDLQQLQQLGLADCIECGCCDYVCPSHITLTSTFISAKQMQRRTDTERQRAITAQARYIAREERLRAQAAQLKQSLDAQTKSFAAGENAGANASKAALARLLERAEKNQRADGE